MAFAQDSIQSDPYSGIALAGLSDALVRLHKETCGRGPTNARCFASGNTVVCLLNGGLTTGERTLLRNGEEAAVREQRESFHRVMRGAASELVEQQFNRRVIAMTMASDPAGELETAVFVLEAPLD